MAIALCQLPISQLLVLNHLTPASVLPSLQPNTDITVSSFPNKDEQKPDLSNSWSTIQYQKPTAPVTTAPYVHPLVSRSSRLMSITSLEMCTESLGSESGSGDFSDFDSGLFNSSPKVDGILGKQRMEQSPRGIEREKDVDQQTSVNYHFSVSRRNTAPRSFPPPLRSISRRDGTCVQMRSRRHDGRLIVDAVPATSRNYLRASRYNGRLLLSFIDSTSNADTYPAQESQLIDQSSRRAVDADDEEEDKEEVEVVDRGTMVEVKLSTQSQHTNGKKKVICLWLVINKFVGRTPLTNQNRWVKPRDKNHRSVAAVIASPTADCSNYKNSCGSTRRVPRGIRPVTGRQAALYVETAKPEELLKQMRQCSDLRRLLLFREAGSFALSGDCLSC